MSKKKEKERGYLNSFIYCCSDLQPGAGEAVDSEKPDFLIPMSDKIVGVEITEIYTQAGANKKSQQSVAAARDRVTAIACQKGIELGYLPLQLRCSSMVLVTYCGGTRQESQML